MNECEYGCGGEAFYVFNNRRRCCSSSPNKCNGKRLRDSIRKAGKTPPPHVLEKAKAARTGGTSWSAGKTKLTDTRLADRARRVSDKYKTGELIHIPCHHTEETKQHLSVVAKNRGLGGYVPGSGRGKKGWYHGIFCDSSWELAYVIWCMDTGKSIKRCEQRYEYVYGDVRRTYIPDFEVDGQIVEVKGYWSEQFDAKLEQSPIPIIVLSKNEIEPILDYVVTKYGKNFTELYEDRKANPIGDGTALEKR